MDRKFQTIFLISILLALGLIYVSFRPQSEISRGPNKSYLFSLDATGAMENLNQGVISEALVKRFENEGHPLSEGATVTVLKEEEKWEISDEGENSYIIKNENETLFVYLRLAPIVGITIDDGTSVKHEVALGATALEALKDVATVETETYSSLGAYIVSINGVAEDRGAGKFWLIASWKDEGKNGKLSRSAQIALKWKMETTSCSGLEINLRPPSNFPFD